MTEKFWKIILVCYHLTLSHVLLALRYFFLEISHWFTIWTTLLLKISRSNKNSLPFPKIALNRILLVQMLYKKKSLAKEIIFRAMRTKRSFKSRTLIGLLHKHKTLNKEFKITTHCFSQGCQLSYFVAISIDFIFI